MIYLTFDDGPGPTTEKILDILDKYSVKATFFVTGMNLENSPWSINRNDGWEIGKKMVKNGHLIGNHTFSHKLVYESENAFLNEIVIVDSLITKLYREVGLAPQTIPVRLPFGVKNNDKRLNYLAGIGRLHTHWTSGFDDWHEGPIDNLSYNAIRHILQRELIGFNSVLDLHDAGIGNSNGYYRNATADAVEKIIVESLKRGWFFSTFN